MLGHSKGNDDYSQPRALLMMFDEGQKQRLFANLAASMQGVPSFIIERALAEFDKVHPDYAEGIAEALAGAAK